MIEPRIELLKEKKLVGCHLPMTFAANRTAELWRTFMPQRNEIQHKINSELISMQVYPPSFNFQSFNPNLTFEKWAAVEVNNFGEVPAGMETFTLEGGLYAVFQHKGGPRTGPETFQYIFGTWLPASGYDLDNRPHFEILGANYKNDDPESEEEIWIPVKVRAK